MYDVIIITRKCPLVTIIVSEDDDEADYSPFAFLQSSVKGDVLNVSHDYRYQKMGYYVIVCMPKCAAAG